VKRLERKRLAQKGAGFLWLRNRWVRGYLMSLPTLALFIWVGGWTGFAVILAVWAISNFELEVLNYLEHYGLIREPDQPIEPRHSWDNTTLLTSAAFIQIGLQGDHHVRGETRFWYLEPVGAPNYGWGYYTLLVVSMIPPWWHAFMKKKLAVWDRDFATPGERAIAEEQNRNSGYAFPVEALGARTL
jgi:alkane 1-monooxygenase